MEIQKNNVVLKENMEFSNILKEAIKIPHKNNINFIIFTLLSSLPLLCTTVFYEMILQTTIIDFSIKLFQLSVLYLVPLHLLELFNVIVTVLLASKLHNKRERPMITLKEMVQTLIKQAKFKRPFFNSLYVLFLSCCTLVGLIWLVINYFFISRNSLHGYPFVIFYATVFLGLLAKYLEWSAVWNMGIVVSILEGNQVIESLMLLDFFSRGREKRGLVLMLVVFFVWGCSLMLVVFFVWGCSLMLPWLYIGCYKRESLVIAQVSLFCVGNLVKWVVCMIYFYDCKNRIIQRTMVDEEAVDAEALLAECENLKKADKQKKLENEAADA